MSKKWVMPEWMKPYRSLIKGHTEGIPSCTLEDWMNDKSEIFINAPRALIACEMSGQVSMLERLHKEGLLKDD